LLRPVFLNHPSLSAQVIFRGQRSAGYGFVALSSAEATEKAVELLNDRELDGRHVIVEIAKAAEQKEKDRKDRKPKRRPGRRGTKAVPGEVTEAEAAGETPAEVGEETTPAEGAARPKKKKVLASLFLCFRV
jgi:RNA recognition motif-containing protein